MKVSREGVVLIKSFEGFRPRAVQREDGAWVIGYGHTRSAREGLAVGEADAELLLQYDLIPVVAALDAAALGLNQHQFDALASFAFSIGVERFQQSDVFQRIREGAASAAADALMDWPETPSRDTALRRRAAERALFVADPSAPVALADLLAAPLPPPVAEAFEPLAPEPATPEQPAPSQAALPSEPAGDVEPAPAATDDRTDLAARSAAVAALLGEPPVVVPVFAPTSLSLEAANEDAPAEDASDEDVAASGLSPSSSADDEASSPSEGEDMPALSAPAADAFDHSAAGILMIQRYSPYAAIRSGPLPGLDRPSDVETASAAPEEIAAAVETAPEAPSTPPPPQIAPAAPVSAFEGFTATDPSPFAPVDDTQAATPLVLTPMEEASAAPEARPAWPAEVREPAPATEATLFTDETALDQGFGPVLRHEVEPSPPAGFDWGGVGAFVVMSGVGLVSIGAALAAVRRALEEGSTGGEFIPIATALGLIGLIAVGVSAWNLYLRLVKSARD